MISRITNKRVFVTGHRGLVGSAILRRLESEACTVLTAPRAEVDLRDQPSVDHFFERAKPDFVIHAAGTVGGIQANNTRPVDFLVDNTLIHTTVLRASWQSNVEKLLYLGSSCIYPRDCPQPIREEYLLSGPLEPTNAAYAIAKISGIFACRAYRDQYGCNFISAMPTNLYGPNDNFDLDSSHVLPALIRKFHDARVAKQGDVVVWGTGTPRREFLHVDDLASACLHLLEHYDDPMAINIGSGVDVSIAELANIVKSVVYPDAKIVYDITKPDGTPRKLLDVNRIHDLGWRHSIDLLEGVQSTYAWFCTQLETHSLRLENTHA